MKTPLSYYSIDWLQIYCLCTLSQAGEPSIPDSLISPHPDRNGYHREYKLVAASEYTHGYTWHRSVMWKDYTVAHISACPSSRLHNQRGCSIKLHNAILYLYDWYFVLLDILDTLHWQAQNITRLDICCDVNYFLGGLLPSTFIRNYISKKNSYIRVGRKANDWALFGQKDINSNTLNSIRWGSRQSGVSVYLYNKSKELADQKDKPYIRYCWKEAGLNTAKDVWRTEISITSQGCGLKDISSSMLHTLFVDDLTSSEAVKTIFQSYAKKYFHFKRIIPGRLKKDMPDLPLLSLENATVWRPVSLQEKRGSGRTEKMVFNRLTELREFLMAQDTHFDKVEQINHVDKVLEYYSEMAGMKKTSSSIEKSTTDTIRKDLLQSMSLDYQRDRLHSSLEVKNTISYYSQLAKNIATKILKIKENRPNNLAHVQSPPTPCGSTEQQKP